MWPFKSNPNVQCAAGYYRLWAIILLLATNVICILLLFIGQFVRRGEGEITWSDIGTGLLTLLVSLTLPSISTVVFYFGHGNWQRLAKEKTYVWQGRCLLGVMLLLGFFGIFGMGHSVIFADYIKHIPESRDPLRPANMSLETRLLYWFTGVSVFLVFALICNLMPGDPYAHMGDGKEPLPENE